jgi:hypothetical protein
MAQLPFADGVAGSQWTRQLSFGVPQFQAGSVHVCGFAHGLTALEAIQGLASAAAHGQIRLKLSEFGVRELAKKKAGIEPGDRLLIELPVVATWPADGKVTVAINGVRFTFTEDNDEIREVPKAAKEKAQRGQGRIGSSAQSKQWR